MTRTRRIVTLVDSLAAGGAERVAVEIACGLDRSRFEPHVVVSRDSGPLHDLLDAAGVGVTVLGRRGVRDLRPWMHARSIFAAADVVHAHKFGSNAWGSILTTSVRRPLIAHEHNFSAAPSRSRTIVDRVLIGRSAQAVVCVSDQVADVERACGIPADLIRVIPNGVRVAQSMSRSTSRAELGLDATRPVIGIVGMLRPEKAHEVLLAAAAMTTGPSRAATICVVGDGPRADDLRALATAAGLDERVVWAGERRDAARLAPAFDVGVVCSDWEGMPLAALETLAAGVPLVATSVGALPDLVGSDAGILVAPRDSAALARALDELVGDPDRSRELGRVGRRRVTERYSFERMIADVQRLYDEVAGAGAHGARRVTTTRPVRRGKERSAA